MDKLKCKVVVWPGELVEVEVEVEVRNFPVVSCPTCGQTHEPEFEAAAAAAYKDGQEFGRMLLLGGSSEYRRGLLEVLRV